MFGTGNFGTEVTWVPSCGLETKLIFGTEILVPKFVYPVHARPADLVKSSSLLKLNQLALILTMLESFARFNDLNLTI